MRWRPLLNHVRESFWFVPSMMAGAAGLGAFASTAFDRSIDRDVVGDLAWAWAGSAEGARSVLSVIAGSTMTVAGVVFSITVTALAQTSAHFGPRVLRNFTADRGNQVVLGTFIATFVFCLLVLRTVSAEGESISVSIPYLSVNIGLLLAVASIGVLIYFIHHIARSLQLEVLLAGVSEELADAVQSLYPQELGKGATQRAEREPDVAAWSDAQVVQCSSSGYLQNIDQNVLLRLARRHDLVVRMCKRPGDFIDAPDVLMLVRAPREVGEKVSKQLRACVSLGVHRTPREDVGYSVQQLVEVAARGLSPGVNELFTALSCIDWLVSALSSVARRRLPSAARADEDGAVRVVAEPTTFVDLADMTFDVLRPYAGQHATIALRLLHAVSSLAPQLARAEDEVALRQHARRVARQARRLRDAAERADARAALAAALKALDEARDRIGLSNSDSASRHSATTGHAGRRARGSRSPRDGAHARRKRVPRIDGSTRV
jgi:uncharacterized membrane protein